MKKKGEIQQDGATDKGPEGTKKPSFKDRLNRFNLDRNDKVFRALCEEIEILRWRK